jgi:1-acyl-sn-glycerol-3-phosphate acyltransferase
MPALRLLVKSLGLAALILLVAPVQALVLLLSRGPASMRLPPLFHRAMCALLGLRVEVTGMPVAATQAVFISNHLSHLDIPAIGSSLRACFVAKDEVRGWPVFGFLARLQHTVFISRRARDAGGVAAQLSAALGDGHRLVLFPEGTTSDGRAVLPFKSSIFAPLAEPALAHVVLQPMTLELLAVDGRPVAAGGLRDAYAYYGDMQLLPHLLAFMRLSGATLRVQFHEPLARIDKETRKQLARRAHQAVSRSAPVAVARIPAGA